MTALGAFVALVLCVCAGPLHAASPKLIVILVGDQVRADYLERYHDDLAPDGLRRFRDEGTYFAQAARNDAVEKTSPGHTLIGSGLYARQSGIVNNDWYDVVSSRSVSAAEIVPGGQRTQLRWFMGKSFAERVHAASPQSRVVSISLKDRGALLLTGPDQDEAYWWDHDQQAYRAYGKTPLWLQDFNGHQAEYVRAHDHWEPLVPVHGDRADAFAATAAILMDHIKPEHDLGKSFPHPIRSLDALMSTPFSDDLSEQLAEKAVIQWKLGNNPNGVDVLTVSFSAVDLVGHQFGPDSQEIMDAFLRLDKNVASLMHFVDYEVGQNVVWVFSSDHGVTAFPEIPLSKGLKAGRVPFTKTALPHGDWMTATAAPFIYLDEKHKGDAGQLKGDLQKIKGVQAVYISTEIIAGQAPKEIERSFYRPKPGESPRSGDLWVVLKPRYIFADSPYGTTHGQPTADDQRVPLGFYGAGIGRTLREEAVSPAVVAPTLLHRLNIPAPDLEKPEDLGPVTATAG